jgi:plastocyanin
MIHRADWAIVLTLAVTPFCSAAALNAHVTTPAGVAVEDAALVLEPLSESAPIRRKTVAVKQYDREFLPYLTVVQTGTVVEFPNLDPIMHHVYSFSPAKVFEIKLYARKPVPPVVFDTRRGGARLQYPRLDGSVSASGEYAVLCQDRQQRPRRDYRVGRVLSAAGVAPSAEDGAGGKKR